MKVISTLFLAIGLVIISGCTTPVAIDPQTGMNQTATYQTGFFYGPLDAPIDEVFRTAIRELDDMGYFRTGEIHRDTNITIFARKVGDQKVTVKTYIPATEEERAEGQTMLRIRVGTLGSLPESQAIYARIRNAL
jgi:hypothetical protein